MMNRRFLRSLAMVAGVCALPFVFAAAESASLEGEEAITKPSEQRELSFSTPGLIVKVDVKEGDVVKKDQVLILQDDRIGQEALKELEIKANSRLQIDFAEKDVEHKKVNLARKERGLLNDSVSRSEYEEVKLEVALAETRLKLAAQEQSLSKIALEKQKAENDQKRMVSPIPGAIRKLEAGEGEQADPSKPALIVVQNDPLWVELNLETTKAKNLKLGQEVKVRYVEEAEWRAAKIIFFDPVVDAASDTQLIRLELKNPENRASGMQAVVKMPDAKPVEAAARAGE